MFVDSDEMDYLKGNKPLVVPSRVSQKNEEIRKVVYKEFDDDKLVHVNDTYDLGDDYPEFTKVEYPYSLNFYDFEVFMGDWMVVIINPINKRMRIIANDSNALARYYLKHNKEIWVGYNSRNYDTYILKGILMGMNPKKINDQIIVEGKKGWEISKDFKDYPLYNFDLYSKGSLKELEGYMGNNIKETSVPFDLDRPLTYKEMKMTVKYCVHDVEQTIEVFKFKKNDYIAQMDLIQLFKLNLNEVGSTKAQLTAKIIGCEKKEHDDEFQLEFVDTMHIKKYAYVVDWFKNSKNYDYNNCLKTDVCGIPHTFGWGGLHGCVAEPIHRKGRIFHADVTSFYPSLMIVYNLLTRNCKDKRKFKQIYDKRVELKRAGKKKEQAPYKIILNSTYGICKDKYSRAFDPLQANNVCINGQLLLLDLLEHLEGHCEILQSNTDGIILQTEDSDEAVAEMKSICNEWIERTKMGLGFDEITEIWQSDVNNYIFAFKDGKYERKGADVKDLDELCYDMPILNESIFNYLVKGISVKDTVNQCNELKKFQRVVRISSNYSFGWHNDKFLSDKTFRVFASKRPNDTFIGKCKFKGATIEKFGDTPERCFIWNESVNGVDVPEELDRQWYVDFICKRIKTKFNIKATEDYSLF